MLSKGVKIVEMLRDGASYSEIEDLVGCSKSTISYHAKKEGLSRRSRPSYDWEEVQEFYNENPGEVRKCLKNFGMQSSTWYSAVASGKLTVLSEEEKTSQLLQTTVNRRTIKRCLVELGVLYQCSICGIDSWRGKKLSLQLAHINGKNADNRVDNLRLLCANCHSQTATYGGRNKKR